MRTFRYVSMVLAISLASVAAADGFDGSTRKGQPVLIGTGYVTAATDTDLDARTVTLHDVTAERFVFTGGESDEQEQAGRWRAR